MRTLFLTVAALGSLAVGFSAARASAATPGAGIAADPKTCKFGGSMVCDPKNTSSNCKYCDDCCHGCDPSTCNGNYCFCSYGDAGT
jgi:hypothetical protein